MRLAVSDDMMARKTSGEITQDQFDRFSSFVERINQELMPHPVITDNAYTRWFEKGEYGREDLRHFIVQFSVFSNLFLIAQLQKTINATTLEGMRASKEILLNELGVIYNKKGGNGRPQGVTDPDREGDPDLVSTEGTVDGGMFKFKAAHFEWLSRMGRVLDLEFEEMGKRRHGTPSTLFFCDELARIYGSADPNIAEGASFAVETWAAAGFWKELVRGLEIFKKREQSALPLAFFTWHDKVEENHKLHVMDELEEAFFTEGFDEEKFMRGGRDMLDGVNAFWVGLTENRIARAHESAEMIA